MFVVAGMDDSIIELVRDAQKVQNVAFARGEFKKESEQVDFIRWKNYQKDLELNMKINNVKSELRSEYLLAIAGPFIQELNNLLPECEDEKITGEYEKLIYRLEKYFKPGYNNIMEIVKFRDMSQESEETINEFVLRLRRQAEYCEFHDVNREIYIQVVSKCNSTKLKEKLLEKDRTLEEVLTLARIHEMKGNYMKSESTLPLVAKVERREYGACFNCGFKGHTVKDPSCPARNKTCNSCNKKGHFMRVCREKEKFAEKKRNYTKFNKEVRVVTQPDCIVEKDEIFLLGKKGPRANILIGGIALEFVIDTGADLNCITIESWKKLKDNNAVIKNKIKGAQFPLFAYATKKPIEVLGTFTTSCKHLNNEIEAKFLVCEQANKNLLSCDTSLKLELIKLNADVLNIDVRYKINNEVEPVKQRMRKIPKAIQDKVEAQIDELEKLDIIEHCDSSEWISPLTYVLKKNGEIRICNDLRMVNKAIIREDFPIPTITEMLDKLQGSSFFASLDLRKAFYQIEVDEDSRHITTFMTSKGLFRFKRLCFGLASAPEIFQKIMTTKVFAGCEGIIVYFDDILVHAKSLHEYNERLSAAMKQIENSTLY
jgi:Reverse transcriptase (RNA-dependent DNA polymerase)